MARCGCTSAGCSCRFEALEDADCIQVAVSGSGTLGDPYIVSADPVLAPDGGLVCSPVGLAVTNSPILYFTVASVETPEPLRSNADFQCDGVDDDVEIQAALDHARSLHNGGSGVVTVFLLPGFFYTSSSINTVSVPLMGQQRYSTGIIADPGVRVIDNTSTQDSLFLRGLDIESDGAAAISANGYHAEITECTIFGINPGTDEAAVFVEESTTIIKNNMIVGGGTSGINNSIWVTQPQSGSEISGNRIQLGGILRDGGIGYPFSIHDNSFEGIGQGGSTQNYALRVFSGTSNVEAIRILNNTFMDVAGDGIQLENCRQVSVINNQIMDYDSNETGTFDGIRLIANVDEATIQGNKVRKLTGSGRHGINIASATCNDNYISDNDLLNSGAGASINDAGTNTLILPMEIATFASSGPLSVGTGTLRFRFPFSATILGTTATVNTAPSGGNIILDVHKNGTTIYTTTGNRPTISSGGATTVEPTPDITAMAAGDYLTVDIDQVGSVVAGSDLTVFIRYTRP